MKMIEKYAQMPDGTLIYYQIYGQGEPLFLLHGNGNNGSYFHEQIPYFDRNFKVYVIDSRAHGNSTNSQAALNFKQMAADIKVIMEQENLICANILGFSDGANIAMWFSYLYPHFVKRLILNAGNTQLNGVKWHARFGTFIQFIFYSFLAIFNKKYQQKISIIRLMMTDPQLTTAELKQISAPTLIIVGKHDVIKQKHSLYLARTIPHAKFVLISRQGHHLAQTAPQQFNQEVLSFFKEVKV